MKDGESPSRLQGTGSFFAVDRDTWRVACDLGMTAAVTYLVLARGSGGNHRTTSWSIKAVETHTGIGRVSAQRAISLLKQELLIQQKQAGSRPQYTIVPACVAPKSRSFNVVMQGAFALEMQIPEANNWIWLPNDLVTSSAAISPIEAVRRTGKIEVLHALVDLYAEQEFTREGGLPWREDGMRQDYRRTRIGKSAGRIVWHFKPGKIKIDAGPLLDRYGAQFSTTLDTLVRIGLVDFVPHLVTGPGLDADVLHSLLSDSDDDADAELGPSTHLEMLASKILTRARFYELRQTDAELLLPIQDFLGDVRVVGIARLRYRAPTRMLAQWRSDNEPIWRAYTDEYLAAWREPQHQGAWREPQHQGSEMQHQGGQAQHQGPDQGLHQGLNQGSFQG